MMVLSGVSMVRKLLKIVFILGILCWYFFYYDSKIEYVLCWDGIDWNYLDLDVVEIIIDVLFCNV